MASALFQGAKHAVLYSKFRPSPPSQLVRNILDYLKKVGGSWTRAVDIGCGSGQSTIVLAPHFGEVCGLDVSDAQLECARRERTLPNVQYKLSSCERLPFADSSVDLVTFCQSVHWFKPDLIFGEVGRVLSPLGVVAVYGYWIPVPRTGDKEKDRLIDRLVMQSLHEEKLGRYWDKERYIVQRHYADVHLPFKNVLRQNFVHSTKSSVSEYLGYLSSWSAYQKLMAEDPTKAKNILEDFKLELLGILGEGSTEDVDLTLFTDYFLLIGHR
ncbi:putative methyltransferase DDB_G0268948 [Uloborus diversus]|uniref:putative methyltransferase DDB_G0268948 n=1 Tax=Uloborus diversus TaxID=327109 RepID=UPI00240A0D9D|nr:putative methyltransferase DDB_G0268948 [Uloborus diversus]